MRSLVLTMAPPQRSPLKLIHLQEFPSLLRWCGNNKDLFNAMIVHHDICTRDIESDPYIGSSLIEMYLKCEAISEAHLLFFTSPSLHSLFTWNLLIRSYRTSGEDLMALQCLHRMHGEGFIPEKYAFVNLISSCINLNDLPGICRIHACIVKGPHECDLVVGNALINAYAKCGTIGDACTVFDNMVEHDSFSWDTLIVAHVNSKLYDEAFHLFQGEKLKGVLPTRITYMAIIEACTNNRPRTIMTTLACVFGSDHKNDVVVGTSIMNMFSKMDCGSDSWNMFCSMPERNLHTWNGIIAATCSQLHQTNSSIDLYNQMLSEGVLPNELTFIRLLSSCTSPKLITLGRYIHASIMASEFVSDIAVHNALINMYNKCCELKEAQRVFDLIVEKNTVSWTTMIVTCVEHGQSILAIGNFHQMLYEGILPDKVLLISILNAYASLHSLSRARRMHALIHGTDLDSNIEVGSSLCVMYGKYGSFKDALRVFDKLCSADVKVWSSMISAHAQHNHAEKAIQIFCQMQQESVLPNKVTFFSLFDACAQSGAISEGRRLHIHILSSGYEIDAHIETALVDMYGKCGSLDESTRIFKDAFKQDIILLTTMMASYAINNKVKHALDLFDKVRHTRLKPDEVTFINVLSMCSHSGLIEEGRLFFSSMSHDYNITPNIYHYSCMIDMLGRAGCLKEAEDMINKMPCPATSLQWMTLLSSCRQKLDIERGERAAHQIFLLDPKNPIPYVELSNIYGSLNRDADAIEIMHKMKARVLA